MLGLKVLRRVVIVASLCCLLLTGWVVPFTLGQRVGQQEGQSSSPGGQTGTTSVPTTATSPAPAPAPAHRPVVITMGKPNIWSLEQAHYLLARLRAESLDLQSKTPTDTELNPNAANGSRISTLATALDIGASFDAPSRFNNDIAARNTRYNLTRRQELEARRDQLYVDLDKVTGEIAAQKLQRERMDSDGSSTEADKKVKNTEIDGLVSRQALIKERITQTNDELGSLTAISGTVSAPTVPDADDKDRTSARLLDKIIGADAAGIRDMLKQDTKLSASTALDNHIAMQYELIAKQLTLLRDEVGPGQRLIFLELPQSIYTTPSKAENKIAQVWWHVDGYVRVDESVRQLSDLNKAKVSLKEKLLPAHPGEYARLIKDVDLRIEEITRRQIARIVSDSQRVIQGGAEDEHQLLATLNDLSTGQQNANATNCTPNAAGLCYVSTSRTSQSDVSHGGPNLIRTIDLIPRQSSLNVNDVQDTVRTNRFSAAFSTLFGFGAKGSYQRQRELYEQYLHQEVYASGFGKGEDTFGWTFGPLPGTKRLAPGLRTTYAILVVPEDAQALQLSARGCYFPARDLAPQDYADTRDADWQRPEMIARRRCDPAASTFTIIIPGARGNSFWVNGVNYRRVRPGERSVVYIDGEDFSAQTGVLVDGVALKPAIGVAQPGLERGNSAGGEGAAISGSYEIINSGQIVLAFTMPGAYKGTPTISLIAPGRARVLNDLRMRINGQDGRTLDEMPLMIAADVEAQALTIANLEVLSVADTRMKAYLTGTRFDASKDVIFVNGNKLEAADKTFLAPGLYELSFHVSPDTERLNVTVVQEKEYASHSFNNPLHLGINQATVLVNELDKTPPTLVIKLEGVGFKSELLPNVEGAGQWSMRYVSPTEVIFKVVEPKEFVVLSLTDVATKTPVGVSVPRPAPPEPPAAPEPSPPKKGEQPK